MSDKMLYIVRGLPGSGKSTLATTLAHALLAPHYEEDMWLYDNDVYLWTPMRMQNAIDLCLKSCELAMQNHSQSIVVSNVFEEEHMFESYQMLAKLYGYKTTYIVVENRRGGVNIHNVPDEALDQMRSDFQVRL